MNMPPYPINNSSDFHPEIIYDSRNEASTPPISVIIPIYNVEDYLKECLDSVIHQALNDIEIICVDDGSTDNSLEIAKAYAEKYSQFIILHQPNKGPSAARNSALSFVRGKYIHFLDSDDVIVPDAYEVLYRKASNENLDVLRFDYEVFYDHAESELSHPISESNSSHEDIPCDSGENLFCQLTEARIDFSPAWGAIYRADYLKSISLSFIEGILNEDDPFSFVCTLKAERIAFISRKLYLYRRRSGSIMTAPTYRNISGYMAGFAYMSYFALTESFAPETQKCIVRYLDCIKAGINQLVRDIPNVEKHFNDYELAFLHILTPSESSEYRIGSFFTYIPHKVKSFVRYMHNHGMKRTISYTIGWFWRKASRLFNVKT